MLFQSAEAPSGGRIRIGVWVQFGSVVVLGWVQVFGEDGFEEIHLEREREREREGIEILEI